MAGKSYTMREMKGIVEYLVDHRAFADIKGRKMWMDFASSKVTNRTWQSLKECFLQRILPDIHNPYYKLTREQILSFKHRQDMEKTINNKLEIQTISEDSSGSKQKENEQPSSSKNNKEAPGEVTKCSKISSRISTSTETLVLDNGNEEPITNEDAHKTSHRQSTRELLTFVEVHAPNEDDRNKKGTPDMSQLNPKEVVQVIIEDFQTESDDSQSVIHQKHAEGAEELQASQDTENQPAVSVKSLRLRKREKTNAENKDKSPSKTPKKSVTPKPDEKDINKATQNSVSKEIPTQKSFNSTDDTQLPNNQEHLVAKANKETYQNNTEKSTIEIQLSVDPDNTSIKKTILKKSTENRSGSESINKQKDTLAESHAKNVNSEIISVESESTDPKVKTGNNLTNTEVESININPCLKSVNLFAEQFSQSRCIDSDLEETEVNDGKKETNKHVDIVKEVVILNSHSESSDNVGPVERPREITKKEQRSLANLLGFTNGGERNDRSRQDKKHSRRFSSRHFSSNSSEWTSESEDEYVSPPRGRRNRHSRKILKPHSARILSLEEEGGLFVMYNKKIYPLVKDGKKIKKYVSYMKESDDEEESYWKLKYVEEKKKAEQLSRLLKKADNNEEIREISSSPTPPNPKKQKTSKHQTELNNVEKSGNEVVPLENKSKGVDQVNNGFTDNNKAEQHLKIKFTKNNEELHLEGNWANIHPVLEQVIHIFHKDDPKDSEIKSKVEQKEIASRQSTPVVELPTDEETRKKVEKLEESIFKEITEKENLENMDSGKESETNVTRRGRKKKVTNSTQNVDSPSKKVRSSNLDTDGSTSKDSIRSRVRPHRNLSRKSKMDSLTEVNKSVSNAAKTKTENAIESSQVEEDSDIRYMFPPATNETNQYNNKHNEIKHKKHLSRAAKMLSISLNSAENSLGYQDSDPSPVQINTRRKRKNSASTVLYRGRYKNKSRRRSYPHLSNDASNESSQSQSHLPAERKTVQQNSTLKSDVYNSESYQILMPKAKIARRPLDNINEICSPDQQDANDGVNFNKRGSQNKNDNILSPYSAECHFGNSSNISLPVSPEISIVENLSVNKTILSNASFAEFPMLNELQANNDIAQVLKKNKYIMSSVDISVPLMEQCGMQLSSQQSNENSSGVHKMSTDSETLLDKTGAVMENDMSSSADSLDQKLRELLLESAKKMTLHINQVKDKESALQVPDVEMVSEKKPNNRKRCSTPHKRKDAKTKTKNINVIIEEERTEACSNGRKSCPPVILVTENVISDEIEISNEKAKPRAGKKKKDVIKVKILKPKAKPTKSNKSPRKTLSGSRLSIPIDSGIHDTESVLHQTDDSIDLIHNHSETCLHANECIGDSLEIVESAKSVISVDSSSSGDSSIEKLIMNLPPESYCNNAQDAVTFSFDGIKSPNLEAFSSETVYYTIASADSFNSMITEDLSDEIQTRPAKWYLLSEDDTSSKMCDVNCKQKSVGASLKQIFPITCAVPNLSTITEGSKEGDSRKPTLNEDGDIRNDIDS